MIPILTSSAMRAADAAAVARRGADALVRDAGTAVALEARRMLTSCYGSRVAVLCGPGLNGADGRVAASWLGSRGARVDVVEVANQPSWLGGYDLVIDAAFGLGCSRPYVAPAVSPGTRVLAVDLPSGVDADSGEVLGEPLVADVTLALGAIKPALVDGPSAGLVGELRFAGLGIVEEFDDALIDDGDLDALIHVESNDHKWIHAIAILAGSPLMPGAAELAARGAIAGGASMVRLTSRGDVTQFAGLPPEVVRCLDETVDRRCRCIVAGPGLGPQAPSWLSPRLADVTVPVVLDADGLDRALLPLSLAPERRWVLTPHDGEFARLTGAPPSERRFDAARSLAHETGCVVLLKGPTTVIAEPSGRIRVVRSGTASLATAGSGDVLAGLIGATIARGHDPFDASALAAHLHGRAGARLEVYAPASELPEALAELLATIDEGTSRPGPRVYVGEGGGHGEV